MSAHEPDDEAEQALVPLGAVLTRMGDFADEAVEAAARVAIGVRRQPVDLDAERAVLGAILLDHRCLQDVLDAGLLPVHFARPAHALTYQACLDLREAGQVVDIITVVGRLEEQGHLDAVGGAAPLAQLASLLPTTAHAGSYGARLVELAIRREVLSAAMESARAAIGGRERPEAIIRFAEHQLERARSSVRGRSRWTVEVQRAHDDLGAVGVKERRWGGPIGKSALALAEADLPPRPWVVRGMLRDRAVAVLGGAPKGGKTWDEAELAIAIASGTSAFGELQVDQGGPVLMVCLEDDERDLRTRLRALAAGRRMPLDVALGDIHYEARGALDLCRDDDCAGVVASARMLPRPPVLICIDPLRDANSGEENSNDDMRAVMHRVRAIRDVLGCAVMLVHHLTKPGDATRPASTSSIFDRFRGAGALRGAWDAGIGKDTKSRTPTCIKSRMEVETRGGRGAGVFGLQLDLTDDSHGNATHAVFSFFRDPKVLFAEADAETGHTRGERIDAAKARLLRELQMELRKDEAAGRDPRPWSSKYLAEQCRLTEQTARRYLAELSGSREIVGTPRGWRALTTGQTTTSET